MRCAALQQRVDPAGVARDLLETLKTLANPLLRELENGGFGVVKNFVGRLGLLAGFGDGRIRHVDQPAQNSLVANDSNVVLDRRPVRHTVQQTGDVAHIADCLQVLLLLQFFDQRDDVNRPRRFGQIHHPRINTPVRVNGKIFRLKMLGCIVEGVIVEQHRAQDGALGFNVCRQPPDAGFHSSHDV